MIWNPINWTAEPFLTLYAFLAIVLLTVGLLMRAAIGPSAPPGLALNEWELAYLAGGPVQVGDVALLCLASRGGGVIAAKTHKITVTDAAPLQAMGREAVGLRFKPEMTRPEFQKAIVPLVERVDERLQKLGLRPTDAEMASFRLSTLPFVGLLLAFGSVKAFVGASRGHPIGILVFFLFMTFLGGVVLAKRPKRTRAGSGTLEARRAANARAARAPLENELLLAVALSGAVVLAGTPYAPIYAASKSMGDGDGGGGGCGGGGGGCGGCS